MRLKRRSSKLTLPPAELNIVSLMDILTTLLFFLLIVASFSRLSVVSGFGIPSALTEKADDNAPKFAFEIILQSPTSATLWLGPISGLKQERSLGLATFLNAEFNGTAETGFTKKVSARTATELLDSIQRLAIPIKQSFPSQLGAILALSDGLPYQIFVDAVSRLSSLDKKSAGFEITNTSGEKELTQVLFPQVVISEWSEKDGA